MTEYDHPWYIPAMNKVRILLRLRPRNPPLPELSVCRHNAYSLDCIAFPTAKCVFTDNVYSFASGLRVFAAWTKYACKRNVYFFASGLRVLAAWTKCACKCIVYSFASGLWVFSAWTKCACKRNMYSFASGLRVFSAWTKCACKRNMYSLASGLWVFAAWTKCAWKGNALCISRIRSSKTECFFRRFWCLRICFRNSSEGEIQAQIRRGATTWTAVRHSKLGKSRALLRQKIIYQMKREYSSKRVLLLPRCQVQLPRCPCQFPQYLREK